ncbi:MAG: RDD family protein [Erysipelotrichaceae bacterium]
MKKAGFATRPIKKKQVKEEVIYSDVGVVRRFIAYIIDWFFSDLAMALPVVLIYSTINQTTEMNIDLFMMKEPYNYIAGMLAILVGTIYFVLIPLYHHQGQTIGKRICSFKIVREDGAVLDFKTLLIRNALILFIVEGSLFTVSKYIREILAIFTGIFEFMKYPFYIGIFFGVVSIVLVVCTRKRKALHDLAAHTKVMMCEKVKIS